MCQSKAADMMKYLLMYSIYTLGRRGESAQRPPKSLSALFVWQCGRTGPVDSSPCTYEGDGDQLSTAVVKTEVEREIPVRYRHQ